MIEPKVCQVMFVAKLRQRTAIAIYIAGLLPIASGCAQLSRKEIPSEIVIDGITVRMFPKEEKDAAVLREWTNITVWSEARYPHGAWIALECVEDVQIVNAELPKVSPVRVFEYRLRMDTNSEIIGYADRTSRGGCVYLWRITGPADVIAIGLPVTIDEGVLQVCVDAKSDDVSLLVDGGMKTIVDVDTGRSQTRFSQFSGLDGVGSVFESDSYIIYGLELPSARCYQMSPW